MAYDGFIVVCVIFLVPHGTPIYTQLLTTNFPTPTLGTSFDTIHMFNVS